VRESGSISLTLGHSPTLTLTQLDHDDSSDMGAFGASDCAKTWVYLAGGKLEATETLHRIDVFALSAVPF